LNGGKGTDTATIESEEELLGRLGYKQVRSAILSLLHPVRTELTRFSFSFQEFIREFTNLSTISFAFSISAHFLPILREG
jgi:hypothetical protein